MVISQTIIVLHSPFGEYTLKLMGLDEMPLFVPVSRSVSSSISRRTSSKFVNVFPGK